MKIAYITPEPKYASLASIQTLKDFMTFSKDLGFDVFILNTSAYKSTKSIYRTFHLFKNLNKIKNYQYVIMLYPYLGNPIVSNYIDSFIKGIEVELLLQIGKKTNLIIYIIDLPIEQNIYTRNFKLRQNVYYSEQRLFNATSTICVFNELVTSTLISRYEIKRENFIEFELLDYGANLKSTFNLKKHLGNKICVVYGATFRNNRGKRWITTLPENMNIVFEFIGPYGDYINRLKKPNVVYRGSLKPQEYINYLVKKAHFGIVEKENPYYELGSTSKFSSYMLAGVPVLVPKRYKYLSSIVKKYGVGVVYDNLMEIPDILMSIESSEYQILARHAYSLGQKLKSGYFFKRAIKTATGIYNVEP